MQTMTLPSPRESAKYSYDRYILNTFILARVSFYKTNSCRGFDLSPWMIFENNFHFGRIIPLSGQKQ